jgi:AcrR family transcriptional regulator
MAALSKSMRAGKDDAPPVMQRRIRIFDAALALFSERGFSAVGIREIADHAGVSKSLINRHFKSKDGLRAAVDAHVMERFQNLLRTILGDALASGDATLAAEARARRLSGNLAELMPLLTYLRHSLLENSDAGHAMFKSYFGAVARHLDVAPPEAWSGRQEHRAWLLLAVMFMQLGPIFLEPHITAISGRSPFHPDSIKARSLTYSLIEEKLVEVREALK